MGDILEFKKIEKEEDDLFEEKNGYNAIFPEMVGQAYSLIRGDRTCNFMVGRLHGYKEFDEISRGYTTNEDIHNKSVQKRLIKGHETLIEAIRECQYEAEKKVKDVWDYYLKESDQCTVMMIKCKDGLMACGWLGEYVQSDKGAIMATFILYAMGFINPKDETLWESAYKYLLFSTCAGTTQDFDGIILGVIKDKVAIKNKWPGYTPPKN